MACVGWVSLSLFVIDRRATCRRDNIYNVRIIFSLNCIRCKWIWSTSWDTILLINQKFFEIFFFVKSDRLYRLETIARRMPLSTNVSQLAKLLNRAFHMHHRCDTLFRLWLNNHYFKPQIVRKLPSSNWRPDTTIDIAPHLQIREWYNSLVSLNKGNIPKKKEIVQKISPHAFCI